MNGFDNKISNMKIRLKRKKMDSTIKYNLIKNT